MLFIPMHQQTPRETRHSRELGQRVDDAVRDYRRQHPELTDAEVHAALVTSLRKSGVTDSSRQRRMAVALIAALVAVFIGVAMNGGKFSGSGDDQVFKIIGLVAAVGAIASVAFRLSRRD